MGFLRRLLGGQEPSRDTPAADPATVESEERARELELLRAEQARFDDLAQRQLRYADYAWQPPAQGGERRADDADAEGPAAEGS
ncbi:MAG TPA: hypothetical protein VK867_13195 [Candidatus Limnocylindrales bacterium]|nr:hypothetical protein [Candidatus Limnocylindrales bacterium]